VDLKQIMLKAMDDMPDTPNMAPLKLFASGPAMEARFRDVFGDEFEIVRCDQVPE
jgi:hypothetical protein